ncbi:MAG: hypothetical protein M0Z71_05165 [Nitrospiraceae bacterium]|nr:hypothetical protein [Nitrospiraceae bacterium]
METAKAQEYEKTTDESNKRPERAAVKIYSEILQAFLWVVQDETDKKTMRERGSTRETIYSKDEVRALKGKGSDHLRAVHEAKTIFPYSRVEGVNEDGKAE